MNKVNYLKGLNTSGVVKLNLEVAVGQVTFRTGDVHNTFTTTNGDVVCVHNDSLDNFSSELSDEGTLPNDWKVSKSKMLYKSTPRAEDADFSTF